MDGTDWSSIYWLLSLTAGIISALIAVYLAPHWRTDSARRLLLLMVAVAAWSLAYAMEYKSPTLALKLWWVKAEYFGGAWVGMLFFTFIVVVTGNQRWLSWKNKALLSIVPMLTIILAVTNQYHHQMWRLAWLDITGRAPVVVYLRAAGFWVFAGYSYILLIISTFILIRSFVSAQNIFRRQLTVVLVGLAAPWVCNALYLFNFQPLENLDLTPMVFTISGVAFAWGLFRYQLLNVIPLAHEAVIDGMGDPVIVLDRHDRIIDINKATRQAFDINTLTAPGQAAGRVFPGLYEFIVIYRKTEAVQVEVTLPVKMEERQWDMLISPLLSRKGRHNGWLIILRDITDRKKAEGALKESEEMHRAMLEAAPNPIVFYNEIGEVIYINPAFTRVYGWRLDELIGKRLDFVPAENMEETREAVKKTYGNTDGNYNFITRRLTKSGEILDVSINSAIYHDKQGNPAGMVVNFTDITRIKQTETELRHTKNYIRNIIDSMPSMLVGVDTEMRVTQWNLETERITGVDASHAQGKLLPAVFPQLEGQITNVEKTIAAGAVRKESRVTFLIDRQTFCADVTIYPLGVDRVTGAVIRVDDVTERQRLEEMIVQSEKMLSVGGLAAGMAHEINNPLAGILQTTQVIQNRLGAAVPANALVAQECGISLDDLQAYLQKRGVLSMLEQVMAAGKRAARIVNNMLSFSRKSDYTAVSTHHLAELLDTTVELVENDYDLKKKYDFRSIEITREYGDNVPPIPCEGSKIQQVFLNILKNGAEAMTGGSAAAPGFIFRHYRQGGMAVVEIEDNGPGMDEATRKRVFEPFFTTKKVGVGTGLGLSVSYFIITETHGGSLDVESGPGKGSKFIIKLPCGT